VDLSLASFADDWIALTFFERKENISLFTAMAIADTAIAAFRRRATRVNENGAMQAT
jgi:hypothetical protein